MTARALYAEDEPDRLVGFEFDREPEFGPDDYALMIALSEIRAEEAARSSEIGSHGRPMSEAMHEDFDPNNRRSPRHYRPRVRVDHAARLLRTLQKIRAEQFPDEDAASLVWTLEPTAGPPPLTYFD